MNQQRKIEVFEGILTNYDSFIESTIWKLTSNRELFAEAYQNAMLAIWCHIEKFDNQQSCGYLYRIVLSSVSKAWRNTAGKKIHNNMELTELICSPENGPPEQVVKSEMLDILRKMILELPQQQGKAVVMRYLESKSYSELAQILQCNESAARADVSRAITRLRKCLAHFLGKEKSHE